MQLLYKSKKCLQQFSKSKKCLQQFSKSKICLQQFSKSRKCIDTINPFNSSTNTVNKSKGDTFMHWYYPILLTCQMHTDYTVSAHDILIFDKYSVVFVRCTDNNQQLNVFKCGIQLIQTVIAQWSKAQVCNLVVVRSSQLRSKCLYLHC